MGRKKKDKYLTPENEFAEFETEEEKKERKKLAKQQEKDKDDLPETGLYNSDGYLFYHTSCRALTKPQIKRAAEHGINLQKRINLNLDECVRIFKNWKKFAKKHNLKLERAEEYVWAKKSDKHVLQHQEENHFWPKLCHGLPHRSAYCVKQRAEAMFNQDFLANLNWDELEEQIQEKFFQKVAFADEVTKQKVKKLLDRGYSCSHVAELVGTTYSQASSMGTSIRQLEKREDPKIIEIFFENAITFGLDLEKLHELLKSSDEPAYNYFWKTIRIKQMSLKIHMSQSRIRELLQKYLTKIWDNYHENRENDFRSEEEKYEDALQVISEKPKISQKQILGALEIFCKYVEKDETIKMLFNREDIADVIKNAGITGFTCDRPEYPFLVDKICYRWMYYLEKYLFEHLRREFRLQVKIHIHLWTWKVQQWNKLMIRDGETRYEAVLRYEMANPLASKMTKKFLKNKEVAEWIQDPRQIRNFHGQLALRRRIGIELFIMYCNQKYGDTFKFPAKLRPEVDGSSKALRNLLEQNSEENSEYLTHREVRKTVEEGTGFKMLTKVSKLVVQKDQELDSEDSEDSDASNDVSELVQHAKTAESVWFEESQQKIKEVFEKADPEKILPKNRHKQPISLSDDEVENFEKRSKQKRDMDEVVAVWKKQKKQKKEPEKQYKSREFLESSESSDEDDGGPGGPGASGESNSDDTEDTDSDFHVDPRLFEDSDDDEKDLEDVEKQKNRDSEDSKDPEDPGQSKKSKKKRRRDSDDVGEDSEGPGTSDIQKPRKHKKSKHQDPVEGDDHQDSGDAVEDPEASDVLEDLQDTKNVKKKQKESKKRKEKDPEGFLESKKHKKSKHRDSEDVAEDPDAPEAPGVTADVQDLEDVKKKQKESKKRKDKDPEVVVEDSEAPDAPEDLQKSKKHKKPKHRDSEDTIDNFDAPGGSEDVKTSKKQKDKDSELAHESEASDAPEDFQKPKKHKTSKKLDSDDVGEESEEFQKPKKHKKSKHQDPADFETFEDDHQDSEDVVEDSEAPHALEDLQDPEDIQKKHKKFKKGKRKDSEANPDEMEEDSEDIPKPKKHKKSKHQDSEDVVEDSEAPDALEDLQDPADVKKKHKKSKKGKKMEFEDSEDV